MPPLYPNVHVVLVGQDGNAFAITGRVREALRRARVPADKLEQFSNEALRGDYDNVLQTAMKWVNVS